MKEPALPSPFRVWVTHMWYDHRDEARSWGSEICATPEQYFRKYKWFLKTLYKHERNKEQHSKC